MGWEELAEMRKMGENPVDLGHGTKYTKVVYEGVWIAINEWHLHPVTGKLCGGFVPFNVESPALTGRSEKWAVHSYEPLTLSPSLLCTMPDCGHHGFITDGRWVPA